MAKDNYRIVTRKSKLALIQAKQVAAALKQHHPEINFEIISLSSTGDKLQQVALTDIGGKGLFTKELDSALLAKEADIAVHCVKDMPYSMPLGLTLAATPERANPFDVFITRNNLTITELPQGAIVGTASPRRSVFIRQIRSDFNIKLLRGNLDTRLQKLQNGDYAAIVLAAAGLERLGYKEYLTNILSAEQMLPAVGQGALALVCRSDATATYKLLQSLQHTATFNSITAERAVLATLKAGCNMAVASFANIEGNNMHLKGWISYPDGSGIIEYTSSALAKEAVELGALVANKLLEQGAARIIAGSN